MVDLGFLLIAFFVMTAELTRPAVTNLNMPADGTGTPTAESKTITLLLDEDRTWYYEGRWEEAFPANKVIATSLDTRSGAGLLIRAKQQRLAGLQPVSAADTLGKDRLVLLIKAGSRASYGSVVKAMDEATINGVRRYALVAVTKEEEAWLNKRGVGQ